RGGRAGLGLGLGCWGGRAKPWRVWSLSARNASGAWWQTPRVCNVRSVGRSAKGFTTSKKKGNRMTKREFGEAMDKIIDATIAYNDFVPPSNAHGLYLSLAILFIRVTFDAVTVARDFVHSFDDATKIGGALDFRQ